MQRPDLSQTSPELRAYVEWLEAQLEQLRGADSGAADAEPRSDEPPLEPEEPPTPFNLITIAASGLARRVPRHLYLRQRRGGAGNLDADWAGPNRAVALAHAHERGHLLILTDQARAYRLPVYFLDEARPRAEPKPFMESLPAAANEQWAVTLPAPTPAQPTGYFAALSERGWVRVLPAHLFGETMREGLSVFRVEEFGRPVSACFTPSDGDLFIATRRGLAVRFPAKTVAAPGSPGLRLDKDDTVVSICGVKDESGVFLLSADGKGTVRQMSGFNANKAPGAGGKIALKTDELVVALTVGPDADLFILSRQGKLIRFKAAEIPTKEGVVQGVNCMALRADKPIVAVATAS
jgi:DNA gyrase subunit A